MILIAHKHVWSGLIYTKMIVYCSNKNDPIIKHHFELARDAFSSLWEMKWVDSFAILFPPKR